MPYKCPPAPLEVAFLIEAELRERGLRDKSEVHFCSPIGRAFTIESVSEMATPMLEQKGIELHTFFNVEAIDPQRKVVQSLEGEELPYDLLILVPPHTRRAVPDRLRPRAGAGRLAADRPRTPSRSAAGEHLGAGRRHRPAALQGRLHGPFRGAGRGRAGRRRLSRAASRPASTRTYTGRVMCFFEVGDGKGTLLRFDYDHPPQPPKPNRIWHLGKVVFNKTYWHTVPRGRV